MYEDNFGEKSKMLCDLVRKMLNIDLEKRADYHTVVNTVEYLINGASMEELTQEDRPEIEVGQLKVRRNQSDSIEEVKARLSSRNNSHSGELVDLDRRDLKGNQNCMAAQVILSKTVSDFLNWDELNKENLAPCFLNATVLTHLQLYDVSDKMLFKCEEFLQYSDDPSLIPTYIRVCFMRINNLKTLNKKEEALQVAYNLSKLILDQKNGNLSIIADLLVLISNLLFLTNNLSQSVEQLKTASSIVQRAEWDQEGDVKNSMVILLIAKIEASIFNYRGALATIDDKLKDHHTDNKIEFEMLKAEILLALHDNFECEQHLYRMEKNFDRQRKNDSAALVKIYSLLFIIYYRRNNVKQMIRLQEICQNIVSSHLRGKAIYNVLINTMIGLTKLEYDVDNAHAYFLNASNDIQTTSREHLSLKIFVFEMYLQFLFECNFDPTHLMYIDAVKRNLEDQCCVDHFCLLKIFMKEIQLLFKCDRLEDAKKIALKMREIMKTSGGLKLANVEFTYEVWMEYPKLLFEQGFYKQTVEEYSVVLELLDVLERDKQSRSENQLDSEINEDCALLRLMCNLKRIEVEMLVNNRYEIQTELEGYIDLLDMLTTKAHERVRFDVYRIYYESKIQMLKKKEKAQKALIDTGKHINDMIRIVNQSKDPYIKLEGLFLIAQYHSAYDNIRDSEVYFEKCFYLIKHDPLLSRKSLELKLEYQSKYLEIISQYDVLIAEDGLDVMKRVKKLSAPLLTEVEIKRSTTANTLFYLKVQYRVCKAYLDMDDVEIGMNQLTILMDEYEKLNYRVGCWSYFVKYDCCKLQIDNNIYTKRCLKLAQECTQDARRIFGEYSNYTLLADEMLQLVQSKYR